VRPNDVAARSLLCPILLLLLIGDGGWLSQASAQTVPPTTPPPAVIQEAPPDLPVDLGRIKTALERPIRVKIDDGRVRFYTETVAPGGPSFKEFSKNFNLRFGPVPGAGMTHQEFLGIVTPKLRYYSDVGEGLKALAWGLGETAGWWAIRKLYKELSEATDERRIKSIRDQIDRELAALRGGK